MTKKIDVQKDLPKELIPVKMISKEDFDRLNTIHVDMTDKILEHYMALKRLLVHTITSIESMEVILKPLTDENNDD